MYKQNEVRGIPNVNQKHSYRNAEDVEKGNKQLTKSEKFLVGCQALAGKPVAEISKEIGISRQYVYRQKANVSEYAGG